MTEKISILGNGAFGTALAYVLASNSQKRIQIWARNQDAVKSINEKHINPKISEYQLPPTITASSDFKEVVSDTSLILECLPSQQIVNVLREQKDILPLNVPFVSCSKGPSFAKEIMKNMPTLLVVASKNEQIAQKVQQIMSVGPLKLFTQQDVIGVEIAGALKNVYALAAGILEGCGFGINTVTGFVVRSTNEIRNFAKLYGANDQTFNGLSGIGDLMLTCFSNLSRNKSLGVRIGKGEKLQDIMEQNKILVEGVPTLDVVYKYAKEKKINMPIIFVLNDLIYDKISIQNAMKKLMSETGAEF